MRAKSIESVDAIGHWAKSRANSPALIEPNGIILSYEDLWEQILAVTSRLQKAGITSQETVAVLVPQGGLQTLAIAGALNHCICAPLQPRTNVVEVEALLRRFAASALIASPSFEEEAQAASRMGLTVLTAGDGESPKDWKICRAASLERAGAESSEAILMMVTSASTGSSKVVPLTAANLDAGISSRRDSLRLTASDRLLQMTSLCHIIGIENALAQFLVGGVVITTRGFDPTAYLDWLRELRPTWYDCAPTVHQAALKELNRKPPENPPSLRFVQSAGAPLPNEVRQGLEQVLRVPVFNDYGMTEACPIATDAFLPGGRSPNSAGRSCGIQVAVMDPSGDLVQPDKDGEIVVRGTAVFSGYTYDPEANRIAFRNGWFRTGDLGRLDQEGNLFVAGRLKEMINRGGEKIMPAEVDAALELHPAVREAASFAVSHPTLGEDVACAVVLQPSGENPINARELCRFAAERLASFKVPRRIFFVDEIPRGELGKPQRWLLTRRFADQNIHPKSPVEATVSKATAGQDEVFVIVHEIWARILNRYDLGFEEDFFEAGGDSLASINMLAEVDRRFGSQTSESAASFLDEPTLKHLASMVGNRQPPRPAARASSELRIFPVRQGAASKRLFCMPPDGQEGLIFRRLATYLDGQMDLSIVRPADGFYSKALFAIEHDGEEVATLIRKAQPEGPYFVGGFCFGGVIAFETARRLALDKQDVRLILFDVPMPGYPRLLTLCRRKIGKLWRRWRTAHNHNPDEERSQLFRISAGRTSLSHVLRLAAWRIMIFIRWLAVPFERVPAVQRFFHWAQVDYFPFYQARRLYAPVIQFITTEEHAGFDGEARFGWRTVARRGIEERFLPLDHPNLFHETNLPKIVADLREWCGKF
jgi:acyl-CoA synthetase (AMP-forming)/AMP-acid ligase II/thioesterase domain-containing protein